MALNFLNNGAFTGKLNVETTGISNTAIFENSGQSFSYTAIKVGEALGNRANLTFVVGDNLAATDIIGEISSLIVSDGGALEGAMSFKTNSGDTLTERMVISSAGALKFNAYGAGTLITDASGNITVASGGGAGGPYLPLTGGTITGNLQILRPSTSAASFSLRRDATGDNDTVGEINYLTTAAPGGDNRLFILRTATQGGTTTTRGGKVTFFSRKIDGGFNASTYDNQGNWVFANNAIVNGNIGLGTTNPVSQLNSTKVIKLQSTGNNEIILDHTDGGVNSDLGLYSWERNNDHLAHIRSAQYSANDDAFIAFHCQPTGGSFANSAANEKMRILPTGNVGIGTINPGYKLDVSGDGRFTSTVTATNFILSSDERFKENIEEACDNRINADWKTFELKSEKGQKRYGVIAQELEETNPEFVRTDNRGFKSVAYIDLLIAKIAELEARLEKAGI